MSETRRYIETMASGSIVSVDIEHSHAATHLREQPGLWQLTQEVLRQSNVIATPMQDAFFETDMGRIVGEMDLVSIQRSDHEGPPETGIRWAKRLNRHTWTPFVVRDKRPLARTVVVVLKHLELASLDVATLEPMLRDPQWADHNHYDLCTTYIGRKTPCFPGDDYATSESLPFWMAHALIWDSQMIQQGTLRYDCPWQ